MPTPDIALQIAELNTEIADTENRIFEHKKRLENQLAKGGDTAELQSAIAALAETLADLEARKAGLHQQPLQARSGNP